MQKAASPDDFRQLLQHRRSDAVAALGKATAQIQSKAAAHGALGSGRLGLLYIEAAEQAWRNLVDAAFDDLRSYARVTDVTADVLMSMVREELTASLPHLREASKFDSPASSRFRDSPDALQHYEAEWAKLLAYLDLKMRQFELGLHDEARSPEKGRSVAVSSDEPSVFRRVSTWVILGIPGALVFFASVPVEQAQSNAAGWLRLLGIDRIPAALTSPGADAIIAGMSILAGLLSATLLAITARYSRRELEQQRQRLQESYEKQLASIRQVHDAADGLRQALEGVEAIHIPRKGDNPDEKPA